MVANVLQKLRKKSISVSDFSSQAWCEKQMELSYLYPRTPTKQMQEGSAIHHQIQDKVYIPLMLQPEKYPDILYKEAYENYVNIASMSTKGICREVKVYGSVNGFRLSGKIDQLKLENGMTFITEDKTTDKTGAPSNATIKLHVIQVRLYKSMLDGLISGAYTYENFSNVYGIHEMSLSRNFQSGLIDMGIADELTNLEGIYKKMFDQIKNLPNVSDVLELRYINKSTKEIVSNIKVNYDKEDLNNTLRRDMEYWNGEREAQPVQEMEKWKCNSCRFFGKECKTWS
ncbi:MAG: exonuclease V [Candidatus Marsarchaeota archaeon]|jgi:exonuclease V|nr:exonuclease V [Candidatus Marsarchaeota archaeon]